MMASPSPNKLYDTFATLISPWLRIVRKTRLLRRRSTIEQSMGQDYTGVRRTRLGSNGPKKRSDWRGGIEKQQRYTCKGCRDRKYKEDARGWRQERQERDEGRERTGGSAKSNVETLQHPRPPSQPLLLLLFLLLPHSYTKYILHRVADGTAVAFAGVFCMSLET